MNVYKIGNKWIASKNADTAFGVYLEHVVIDEMKEGETEEVTIQIRKLTRQEIEAPDMNCCFAGCECCEDRDEPLLVSLESFTKARMPEDFPCVIACEE